MYKIFRNIIIPILLIFLILTAVYLLKVYSDYVSLKSYWGNSLNSNYWLIPENENISSVATTEKIKGFVSDREDYESGIYRAKLNIFDYVANSAYDVYIPFNYKLGGEYYNLNEKDLSIISKAETKLEVDALIILAVEGSVVDLEITNDSVRGPILTQLYVLE